MKAIDFLKSLFRYNSRKVNCMPTPEHIGKMSFSEILLIIPKMNELVSMRYITALTKRLYEIALYDNHVPDEHRAAALELIETLKLTVERSLTPEVIKAYRDANTFMESKVHSLGVGSLAWLIQEYSIPPHEIVNFIAKPEYKNLLEDFLLTISPELADKIKLELYERNSPDQ
jgi:hypothetical protein